MDVYQLLVKTNLINMSMENNLNQLEPPALIDAFLKYPPETFDVYDSKESLPYFTTQFNLLTTLDVPVRKKIESMVGYKYWGKLLYLSTCFIGTTVTFCHADCR